MCTVMVIGFDAPPVNEDNPMSEAEDDLRATADSIASDAERLAAIEEEKLTLPISDPRILELSAAAESIARNLVPKTVAERSLAAEAQG